MGLSQIKVNNTLNKNIFENEDNIKPKIRLVLINMFHYFFKDNSIDIPIYIEDLTLTGSIVNYNYNKHSDIDLHIVMDFTNTKERILLKEYLSNKAKLFNFKNSDLNLFGHTIEFYFQDKDEVHNSSGVYSLFKDEWLTKPTKLDKNEINKEEVKNKYKKYKDKIEFLINSVEDVDKIGLFVDKLKAFRKRGLNKSGELSTENLVFKLLRNDGSIEKLYKHLKNKELKLNLF